MSCDRPTCNAILDDPPLMITHFVVLVSVLFTRCQAVQYCLWPCLREVALLGGIQSLCCAPNRHRVDGVIRKTSNEYWVLGQTLGVVR